jgi:hypothetical protein
MCLAELSRDKRFARDFKLKYERSFAARMFTKQTRVACTQGLTPDEPCCEVTYDSEKRGTCRAIRRRTFNDQVEDRTQQDGFCRSTTPTPGQPQSLSLDRAPHDVGHVLDGKFVLDFHDVRDDYADLNSDLSSCGRRTIECLFSVLAQRANQPGSVVILLSRTSPTAAQGPTPEVEARPAITALTKRVNAWFNRRP